MAAHRGRNKRRATDNTMSVWDLGNKMRNATKGKNLISKLPKKCADSTQASNFLGHMCLLEINSPMPKGKKGPYYDKKYVLTLACARFPCINTCSCRTHMFCKITKWTKAKGFYIQPLNSFGEEDGQPMVENPDNVSVLPAVDRELDFGAKEGKLSVASYIMASESVQLTPNPKKRQDKG